MYRFVALVRAIGSAVCRSHDPRDVDMDFVHGPVNEGGTPEPRTRVVGPERFALRCTMGEPEQYIGGQADGGLETQSAGAMLYTPLTSRRTARCRRDALLPHGRVFLPLPKKDGRPGHRLLRQKLLVERNTLAAVSPGLSTSDWAVSILRWLKDRQCLERWRRWPPLSSSGGAPSSPQLFASSPSLAAP